MFCPNCGKECDITKPFCQHCGARLNDGGPVSAPALSPVRAKLQSLAASPTCMTAVIAFTVYLALFFISEAFLTPLLLRGVVEYIPQMDLGGFEYELYEAFSASLSGSSVLSVIPSMAVPILTGVAMWLMVTSAKKGQPNPTGLNIIRVISIIQLVVYSILCVILILVELVCLILLLINGPSAMGGGEFAVFLIVYILVFLIVDAILTMGVLYYITLLKAINGMMYTITTDTPYAAVSGYLIFYCWFNGIACVFSGLSGIAMAVSCISFGLFLSNYKREMAALKRELEESVPVVSVPPIGEPTVREPMADESTTGEPTTSETPKDAE